MTAADAAATHLAAPELSLKFATIPAATLLAFKIVPGTTVDDATFAGQSSADWSAVYAQFTVQHAVRYLPNHWDRGHSEASLVAISTRRPLPLCVCSDELLKRSDIDSAAKAAWVRQALQRHRVSLGPGPLMQEFGERIGGCLVTFDAEEQECVLPHQLVTPENFTFMRLCSFVRDEQQPWATAAVQSLHPPLVLSKDDKQDAARLGRLLGGLIFPNTAVDALAFFAAS